jgi:uncharacterized Ntn-hydrolase superfamily protein/Zn-dependent M28 family amino/carboxypeptidase
MYFLNEKFLELGLEPGNGDSFFQDVPLVEITTEPATPLHVSGIQDSQDFSFGDDFVGVTLRVVEEVSLKESEMVFVGYGIIAPEYNWNDYADIDVKGKTVVILVNDPGFATEDPKLFNGKSMTYYGRWTYKYEEAARQGAAGAIIIHETAPAAYGWGVVENGWTGPQFNLISEDKNLSRCAVEGWITTETTYKIFQMAELDYDELKSAAKQAGFKAVPFGLKASITVKNKIRESSSRNFLALLPGSERADETIFYMAHWDHFGIDPDLERDKIFNGALDNATGTAALIEIAEAFKTLKEPPKRSVVFMAVTAEEQRLLGSMYYATHPIYPTHKTVAAINMDALNIYGRMKDITVVGYGNSELDDYVEAEAVDQDRTVRPDPTPERGSFYRSDHFSFAKQGIPSINTKAGIDHIEHGKEWTLEKMDAYRTEKYHKPSDEYDPGWDLSGAVDDMRLLFKIGYKLSMESSFPNWREGNEFKAIRDKDRERSMRPAHTYSIVAYDNETGQFGAAVQSHWFSVGPIVPWVEAEVGAVATQSFVEVSYGPLGLSLMRAGKNAKEALSALLAADKNEAVRQVAMIDNRGQVSVHTGKNCIPEAGHYVGDGYSCQANLMLKNTVWKAMAIAFENTEGELADRLYAALEAAEKEGGDIRGKQSAALIVVSGKSSGAAWKDRIFDLRVDDHPSPLKELKRLINLNKAYNYMNKGDDFLTENKINEAMIEYTKAMEMYPENAEMIFWPAVTLAATGKVEKSLPLFKKVFEMDANWAILVPRLAEVGQLPADESLIKKILSEQKDSE